MKNNQFNSFNSYFTSLKAVLLSAFLMMALFGFSQKLDTTNIVPLKESDSVRYHSPKKASIMSAILPGLGQVYNKQYWKLPIIYTGLVGFVYMFDFNQSRYVKYRDAYKCRIDEDATTTDDYIGTFSDNDLFELQKSYRRFRDIAVIGTGLLYLLNIVDASVSAHLFTFDVSDDLSLNIQPNINYVNFAERPKMGLSITLKL